MAQGPKASTRCAARAFCAATHLDEVSLQWTECHFFFSSSKCVDSKRLLVFISEMNREIYSKRYTWLKQVQFISFRNLANGDAH